MVGLVLAIIDYEFDVQIRYVKPDPIAFPNAMDDERNQHKFTHMIRLINLITTLIAVYSLFKRQMVKVEWVNTYFAVADQEALIFYQYDDIIVGNESEKTDEHAHTFNG